jgi:cysteinyl-tRNA synthetase
VKDDFSWSGVALELYERVAAALNEDLDTPKALAQLFEALSSANALADDGHEDEARELAVAINALFGALGLALVSASAVVDEISQALVNERDGARTAQNWAEADRLRGELVGLGWTVEDSPSGTLIRRP